MRRETMRRASGWIVAIPARTRDEATDDNRQLPGHRRSMGFAPLIWDSTSVKRISV